jgi:hypothetical protein
VKRLLATASTLVALCAPLIIVTGTPAEAATRCGGTQAVGHGISMNPCIGSANGSINMTGTTFNFVSNPLEQSCQIQSIIYDNNTGAPSSNDGTDSIAQCTVNADHHGTWSPNAILMALVLNCTPGHTYYGWIGLVGTDLNGNSFSTNFLSVGSVAC